MHIFLQSTFRLPGSGKEPTESEKVAAEAIARAVRVVDPDLVIDVLRNAADWNFNAHRFFDLMMKRWQSSLAALRQDPCEELISKFGGIVALIETLTELVIAENEERYDQFVEVSPLVFSASALSNAITSVWKLIPCGGDLLARWNDQPEKGIPDPPPIPPALPTDSTFFLGIGGKPMRKFIPVTVVGPSGLEEEDPEGPTLRTWYAIWDGTTFLGYSPGLFGPNMNPLPQGMKLVK